MSELTQTDKEAIVATLKAKPASVKDVAHTYGVHPIATSKLFKRMTGKI